MSDTDLSGLERAILDWTIAHVDDPELREQAIHVVSARRDTGAGCYTHLVIAEGTEKITGSYGARGPLSGPYVESAVLDIGGGSLLWFQDGYLDHIEMYAYGDEFPEDHEELQPFTLSGEGPGGDSDRNR